MLLVERLNQVGMLRRREGAGMPDPGIVPQADPSAGLLAPVANVGVVPSPLARFGHPRHTVGVGQAQLDFQIVREFEVGGRDVIPIGQIHHFLVWPTTFHLLRQHFYGQAHDMG